MIWTVLCCLQVIRLWAQYLVSILQEYRIIVEGNTERCVTHDTGVKRGFDLYRLLSNRYVFLYFSCSVFFTEEFKQVLCFKGMNIQVWVAYYKGQTGLQVGYLFCVYV